MKIGLSCRVQGHDQRPSIFQVLFQVAPLPVKSEGPKAMLIQVVLDLGGVDPVCFAGIERLLDLLRICAGTTLALLALPVLQDHRNAGSAAAVFSLLDE